MMDLVEAMKKRHSVRQYKEMAIEEDLAKKLREEIERCNEESGMNFQLVTDEPKAFDCMMARYGRFSGVSNYVALVGKKSNDFDEKCGYYGERIVLEAQRLGLHSCWAAISYSKTPGAFEVKKSEKLALVIAIGYGRNKGLVRKSKSVEEVSNAGENTPEWFREGVRAALMAPTAMNQQKFYITYNEDGTVSAKAGAGFYTKMDLGIVKYHFEVATGRKI